MPPASESWAKSDRRTLAAALTGAVTISFSAIFFALSEVEPVTGAFFRAAYALPALSLLWLARRREETRRPRRRWRSEPDWPWVSTSFPGIPPSG